ncbi:DUF6206 family protein [Tropicimonas sediminicola]|uniref:Phosphotransferase enzyme family protein n=1 Tax=Tropicimonas sediminicola TaxID=1031541 RepID=A0A239LVA2_9RHOB|nr:DUF6206 family protein [Tropicimonas sediminicola]SNT33798.1 hypothetical protein SAMN05421757_11146 [Tropicimonas sediminicola]
MAQTETELRDLLEAGRTEQGEPISRLGYFCAPFRPSGGPFAGKVIKRYPSHATSAELDRLADAHDAYLCLLLKCGVAVPQTEFHLVETRGRRVPVIVQEGLSDASMMRRQMISGTPAEALALMQAAGELIADFWAAVEGRTERIGFHPSIRNLAVIDGRAIFFDTFPPLIGYDRDEMGQLLITFSGSPLMRAVGPLLRKRVTAIQDEWYSPAGTLIGLVGSACRLRPVEAPDFLDWGCDFAERRMPRHAQEVREHLAVPPRLPGYWTATRKLLGLKGEPNL